MSYTTWLVPLLATLGVSAAVNAQPVKLPDFATVDDALRAGWRQSHDVVRYYSEWMELGLHEKSEFESTADYQGRLAKGAKPGGVSPGHLLLLKASADVVDSNCNPARYNADAGIFSVTCDRFTRTYDTAIQYGGIEGSITAFCILQGRWKQQPSFPRASKVVADQIAAATKREAALVGTRKQVVRQPPYVFMQLCMHVEGLDAENLSFKLELPYPKEHAARASIHTSVLYVMTPKAPLVFVDTSAADIGSYTQVLLADLQRVIVSTWHRQDDKIRRISQSYRVQAGRLAKAELRDELEDLPPPSSSPTANAKRPP